MKIQLANLMQARERPAAALDAFDQAAGYLDEKAPPYLAVTITAGQVTTLCDMDRPMEARRVLASRLDAFEADGAPHAGALLRFYEGRIALGLGELAAAEERFATATRVMMQLDRGYDAALAAFYLAETFLAQGQLGRLQHLAERLVQEFARRQVAGEISKAMRLLAQAAAAQEVTAVLLATLRRRIEPT